MIRINNRRRNFAITVVLAAVAAITFAILIARPGKQMGKGTAAL